MNLKYSAMEYIWDRRQLNVYMAKIGLELLFKHKVPQENVYMTIVECFWRKIFDRINPFRKAFGFRKVSHVKWLLTVI